MYTHTFEFSSDGTTIEGEVEFNVDGRVSYKTSAALPNLTLQQASAFNGIVKAAKDFFDAYGALNKIKIETK